MPKGNTQEFKKLKESDRKLKERYRKQNERNNKIYDRINFTVPAGKKAEIEAAADASGLSLNAFCRDAVLKAVSGILEDDLPDFMKE